MAGGDIPWRGERLSAAVEVSAANGLNIAAQYLLGVAQTRTPKDTLALTNSGGVANARPGDLTSAVTFDTVYAVRQHNDLSYRHNEGGPLYLEGPMNEEAQAIMAIVARGMSGAFSG